MLGGLGLGDLLDLPPLRQRELRRAAAFVSRIRRIEPVGVEVPDYIADPVLPGERDLRDRSRIHALSRQQHHLRPPPGHHRPAAPADNPHQPLALIIVDLAHPQPFTHRASLGDQRLQGNPGGANLICYGTRRLDRCWSGLRCLHGGLELVDARRGVDMQGGEDVAPTFGELGALAEGPGGPGEGPHVDPVELAAQFRPRVAAGVLRDAG
jgi:hypothetical protein